MTCTRWTSRQWRGALASRRRPGCAAGGGGGLGKGGSERLRGHGCSPPHRGRVQACPRTPRPCHMGQTFPGGLNPAVHLLVVAGEHQPGEQGRQLEERKERSVSKAQDDAPLTLYTEKDHDHGCKHLISARRGRGMEQGMPPRHAGGHEGSARRTRVRFPAPWTRVSPENSNPPPQAPARL